MVAGLGARGPNNRQENSSQQSTAETALKWLAHLLDHRKDIQAAVVVLGEPGVGPYQPVCQWPEQAPLSSGLTETAELALAQRRGTVRRMVLPGEQPCYFVAQPVQYEDRLAGIVCVQSTAQDKKAAAEVLRGLEWAVRALALTYYEQQPARDGERLERLQNGTTQALSCLAQDSYESSCIALCTELSITQQCERVSVGFSEQQRTRLKACSAIASFSAAANLTRAIESAMDEALDEGRPVCFPSEESDATVSRAHRELASTYSMASALSVPFSGSTGARGAITFEREHGGFSAAETRELSEVVALCGPILDLQRRNNRSTLRRLWGSVQGGLSRLLGPGHWLGKAMVVALLLLLGFLALYQTAYRVAAEAVLEGAVERTVTAPFASYVAEVLVDPGDHVEQGQLMVALDDNELQLEMEKWTSQREQLSQQYQEATANYSLVETQVFKAQLGQAVAQIDLLTDQLSRSQVTAPMAGVVISGDWRRSIGEPVERGQELFKVSPLTDYRVALQVDERDIEALSVGDTGELALSAMPDDKLGIRIVRITPVSTSGEGRNTFRVEAQLLEQTPDLLLRPGMTGSGKVEVGQRTLLWIWTHRFFEWVRLQLWSWFT